MRLSTDVMVVLLCCRGGDVCQYNCTHASCTAAMLIAAAEKFSLWCGGDEVHLDVHLYAFIHMCVYVDVCICL